jgi:hypothetical protein
MAEIVPFQAGCLKRVADQRSMIHRYVTNIRAVDWRLWVVGQTPVFGLATIHPESSHPLQPVAQDHNRARMALASGTKLLRDYCLEVEKRLERLQ